MSTHDSGPKFLSRLGALTAAALLLHAVILGGADWAWPSNTPPPLPAATLQVRVMAPAAPVAPEPIAVAKAPPQTPVNTVRRPVPRSMPAAPLAPVADEPATLPISPAARPAMPVPAPASADEEAPPLYSTQLPSATTLRYEVSRGALRGTGELVWRPQGERYELQLDFRLSGLTILSQLSTGSLDATGLAPLRFTDRRVRRGTTAANFQRRGDQGGDKITYSGSASEFELKPGAQDRLSWMLQLAGIVSAEPQLALPGARVLMQVTGARGDAGIWVFRCIGVESVDARGGAVDALKFVREPREAYDTTIQVWLDPRQGHLPVRATQKSGAGDEGYALRLVEVVAPN